ncbi:EKC/KEOPS complex subunit GON7 [Rhynchonycteris naso]
MEVSAEYTGLDGQTRQLRVLCDAPRDADPYQGLLAGVAQMRDLVAELFSPQAQQGAQGGVAVAPDEALDGDDEDDAEDENNDNRTNSEGPSDAKRPKPPSIS